MQRVELGGWHLYLAERIPGLLHLVPMPDVAILHAGAPLQLEDVVYILERHGEAFETVRQLHGDG